MTDSSITKRATTGCSKEASDTVEGLVGQLLGGAPEVPEVDLNGQRLGGCLEEAGVDAAREEAPVGRVDVDLEVGILDVDDAAEPQLGKTIGGVQARLDGELNALQDTLSPSARRG